MPQLTGPEQKFLIELLVGHLTEPGQLDRSLVHAGLGNLANYSEKGTLDSMTADLVRALASQFRIVEFVESVLAGDFLKGHCPPIEAWLESNRAELLRRKLRPTVLERLTRFGVWQLLRWMLATGVAVLIVWGIWNFPQRDAIGPLPGQPIDLASSAAPLTTMYLAHPTRGMRDLTDYIQERADAGAVGSVFICNPAEVAVESPTVEVQVIEGNGQRLQDPDGIFEIHWLAPDQNREDSGRWSPKLHLNNGVVTDKYEGLMPIGTTITVLYQCKERHPFPLVFNVWLR